MWQLVELVTVPAAIAASIGYFFLAHLAAAAAGAENEKAERWVLGLFIAHYLLLMALGYAWLG